MIKRAFSKSILVDSNYSEVDRWECNNVTISYAVDDNQFRNNKSRSKSLSSEPMVVR
jgi:hypothetical protein